MKVVIINGCARCGKDSFVKFVKKNNDNIRVLNYSTVDPTKEALIHLGWDGIRKDKTLRKAMADLKQLSIKLFNGPFNYIKKEIKIDLIRHSIWNNIYFVHCREPNEIQKFVDYYGHDTCITLLIRSKFGKRLENGADDVVEDYQYDYIINNNETIIELEKEANNFAENYLIPQEHNYG